VGTVLDNEQRTAISEVLPLDTWPTTATVRFSRYQTGIEGSPEKNSSLRNTRLPARSGFRESSQKAEVNQEKRSRIATMVGQATRRKRSASLLIIG